MVDCIFCKIVNGEIPCYKIFEDKTFMVFLDAFPSMRGQVLVIPKNHVGGYLFDMDSKNYLSLMNVSRRVAKAMDRALGVSRTGMVVEGLEVDHIHIKLYPLSEKMSLDLNSKIKISDKEMSEIAKNISESMM